MDTVRLRSAQQPSRVERLLDSYVLSTIDMPEGVRRIRDRSELPSGLQRVIRNAERTGQAWSAWTDDWRIWCFTGEMSLPLSRERGQPVLRIRSYDQSGRIIECGVWVNLRHGAWQRCTG